MAYAQELDRNVLPIPEPSFAGQVGLTAAESVKDFPQQVAAPEGAPNIVIIMTDDVGFAASEVFGGPIPTPAFERVAEAGVVFNRFHTTAQCSPTRAALLTGRNHHTAGTGSIMEMGVGYPGYNTLVSRRLAGLGQILKYNGYNTAWFGKNHNIPDWQTSQSGPFDLWPVGLGFEYFYGFVGGDTSQWAPALVENMTPIEPPHDDPDYHLDADLADKAIERLNLLTAMSPDKPFLFYYVPGTSHAPHHAPEEWIDRFGGRFDAGWDALREEIFARQKELGVIPQEAQLTPRPEQIPAWDSLEPEKQRVFARMMEVYAGALAHADDQITRFLDALEASGEADNTLIFYIMGDNGPSGEGGANGMLNEMAIPNGVVEDFESIAAAVDELGGPMYFNHMPVGWGHALATPFQWTKLVASHFGGTRNALAVSWPGHIPEGGEVRPQFHHVIDILPTVLEAAGIPAPVTVDGVGQAPIQGVSMAYAFGKPEAEGRRTTQYFEIFALRGVYHDGWMASTTPPSTPWAPRAPTENPNRDYQWELYNLEDDFSQANDLAAEMPDKLREMQDVFLGEAAKYDVLPIDDSNVDRFDVANRPSLTAGRDSFVYRGHMRRIPEGSAPDLRNRSWSISGDITVPEGGGEGVLMTLGGRFNGVGLYLLEGKPTFVYNFLNLERTTVQAPEPLAAGAHEIVLRFDYQGGAAPGGPADVTLSIDGTEVASASIERTIPLRFSLDETMDIGEDSGTPVSEDYAVPFRFNGEIEAVTISLAN